MNIPDVTQSPVLGDGVVQVTPSLSNKCVICFKIFDKFVIHQPVYQTK